MKKPGFVRNLLLILSFIAGLAVIGCSPTVSNAGASGTTAPTVASIVPASGATSVAVTSSVVATFSEAMDSTTINATNFTLKTGTTAVAGTVTYASKIATFKPTANLAVNTQYTATITTGVKDSSENALATAYSSNFTTGSTIVTPTVSSTSPALYGDMSTAAGVVTATFSKAMAATTLTSSAGTEGTFRLTGPGTTPVSGAVSYSGLVATFTPTSTLTATVVYTATISTAATDSTGNPLASAKVWTFYGGSLYSAPLAVNLRGAGNYVILAISGIAFSAPADLVNGDIGIGSGYTSTAITGLSLSNYTAGDAYETDLDSPQWVTGKIYAPDYTGGTTAADLGTASTDMGTAITTANGLIPNVTSVADISGLTLTRGIYASSGSGLLIDSDVTLWGSASDVFIFQITGALAMASSVHVVLSGGVLPQNVFWIVSGPVIGVSIGTSAQFNGIVLSTTEVDLGVSATMNGRLYSKKNVDLKGSNIVTKAP